MPPTLVDTHCHLDMDRFDEDRAEVIARAGEAGVRCIVVPGLDAATSRAALALGEQFTEVYAAVGWHPNSMGAQPPPLEGALADLRAVAAHQKVVAIGEIGLDYYWDRTPAAIQQSWLAAQLDLAAALRLPVILHNRDSTADLLGMLADWVRAGLPAALADRPGVLHSFSADWAAAERALALGFYIGITGPITFKNAGMLREVAQRAPLDRLLVETDAPFLTPHPYRGQRNEPANVQHTAARLAELRGIGFAELARATTENARKLLGPRLECPQE